MWLAPALSSVGGGSVGSGQSLSAAASIGVKSVIGGPTSDVLGPTVLLDSVVDVSSIVVVVVVSGGPVVVTSLVVVVSSTTVVVVVSSTVVGVVSAMVVDGSLLVVVVVQEGDSAALGVVAPRSAIEPIASDEATSAVARTDRSVLRSGYWRGADLEVGRDTAGGVGTGTGTS